MKLIFGSVLAISMWFSVTAHAQVTVSDAWVRTPVAGQQVAGAYMKITSKAKAFLLSASSPDAKSAAVHEMAMDKGVMKMRAVPRLELPAGKTVELNPSGYHVMLENLKRSLKQGDTVPIRLTVEGEDGKRQNIDVKAEVRAADAMSGNHGGMKM